MLAFVPVHFAVYRPLKPRLRWASNASSRSLITPAAAFHQLHLCEHAGISKSAAGRDLAGARRILG